MYVRRCRAPNNNTQIQSLFAFLKPPVCALAFSPPLSLSPLPFRLTLPLGRQRFILAALLTYT